MRLVLSRRLSDNPVGRDQWNAHVKKTVNATIFQTYEWFECWWAAFGGQQQLFLITMWDGELLVGIAPLMILRRRGLRQLEFVGSPNADYQDFILGKRSTELLPILLRYIFEQRNSWDMMVLRNVPTDSPTFALLPKAARSIGLKVTDTERVDCPTLEIDSRPEETRKLLNRYSFRRRIKGLRQRGELTFTRCTTEEQLDRYLPQFFDQYVERRHGTRAAVAFQRPDVRAFYSSLARSLLRSGWLHFSVLESAGHQIAFHFGFEFDCRLYWYKPSFDPAFARNSPGKVHLSFLIRDASTRRLQELDFTVGSEPFKYRYSSTHRTNANLRVFSRSWLHRVFQGLVWTRGSLRKWRSAWPE